MRFEDGDIPSLPAPQLGSNTNGTADVQQQQNWPLQLSTQGNLSATSQREGHTSQAEDGFGTLHIADVLNAAFASFEEMETGVAKANKKREVLKSVLSSDSDSADNSKMKLAERIAKCRHDGATNAEELLSWLVVSATESNMAGKTSSPVS